VTCSGSVFQMRAPATGKAREPIEVSHLDRRLVSSGGPEFVTRKHVGNTDELPQTLRYIAGRSRVRQDGNLVGYAHRRSTAITLT